MLTCLQDRQQTVMAFLHEGGKTKKKMSCVLNTNENKGVFLQKAFYMDGKEEKNHKTLFFSLKFCSKPFRCSRDESNGGKQEENNFLVLFCCIDAFLPPIVVFRQPTIYVLGFCVYSVHSKRTAHKIPLLSSSSFKKTLGGKGKKRNTSLFLGGFSSSFM